MSFLGASFFIFSYSVFFPYSFLPNYGSCELFDSMCPSYGLPLSCFGCNFGVSVDLPASHHLSSLPCGHYNGHFRSFWAFLSGCQGKACLEVSPLYSSRVLPTGVYLLQPVSTRLTPLYITRTYFLPPPHV